MVQEVTHYRGMTRAAIYKRISDDREGRELGISRQDQDLRQLADQQGYTIVAEYADNDIGASTRSRKSRPGYAKMIKDAEAGAFGIILAYTSSRLTRRPLEHEGQIRLAEQHGIRFEFVRSPSFDLATAAGRQIARMLAAQDAAESEIIGERVTRARRQQAEQGRFGGGGRRFGFEPDGITRREDECKIIAECANAIIRGASLRGLTRDLREAGIPTVTGGHWNPQSLRDILLRPRNAGRMVYQDQIIGTAPWKPIVNPDVHDRVVRILTNPERDMRAGTAPRWLGSGLYRCGTCSAKMEITIGGRSPRYRCKASTHLARAQQPVDDLVVGTVLALIRRDAPELFATRAPGVDVAALRGERDRIEAALAAVGGDVALGLMTRAAGLDATRRGSARIAEIEAALAAADGPDPVVGELARARDPLAVWNGLSLERQRMVIGSTVTVTIERSGRRGRVFDPDSVRIESCAMVAPE
jgi:DNA invertase Pin-like site-specific DNA recombinase